MWRYRIKVTYSGSGVPFYAAQQLSWKYWTIPFIPKWEFIALYNEQVASHDLNKVINGIKKYHEFMSHRRKTKHLYAKEFKLQEAFKELEGK